jgi:tRNA(fMet)-specific endonuclease VapC
VTRYLLDTNAFSQAAKGRLSGFKSRFDAIDLGDVAVSVITEAELLFGLVRRPLAHELANSVHALLRKIEILPWTSESAKIYAELRFTLERRGQPMSAMDMMIAAHVLAEDAILVTNDAAFRRIERLRAEDWTAL